MKAKTQPGANFLIQVSTATTAGRATSVAGHQKSMVFRSFMELVMLMQKLWDSKLHRQLNAWEKRKDVYNICGQSQDN